MRWQMVSLHDVCCPKQWPTISMKQMKPSGYPVYGANGQIGFYDQYNHEEPTILITCRGATCGTINVSEPFSYINGNAMALDGLDQDRVEPRFLYHFLNKRKLQDVITGTAQPQITRESLKKVEIPLPPLAEQRRIAAILDTADALREKRQQIIAKYDTLLRAVFLEMFGEPQCNEWRQVPIKEIAAKHRNAIRTGPFGSQLLHSEFVDDGVAVLGIDNAVQNTFSWRQRRFITERKYEMLSRYRVFPADLLITIMGTCGRCAIVPNDIPLAINTKHLCCITLNHEQCLPVYLQACFLNHPRVLRGLGVSERGAVMPGLNMQIIKDLVIPLPPLHLQKKFAEIARRLDQMRKLQQEAKQRAEILFNGLQQRAFTGKLFAEKAAAVAD